MNSVMFPFLNKYAGVSVKQKNEGTIDRNTKIVDKRFKWNAVLTQNVDIFSTIQPNPYAKNDAEIRVLLNFVVATI